MNTINQVFHIDGDRKVVLKVFLFLAIGCSILILTNLLPNRKIREHIKEAAVELYSQENDIYVGEHSDDNALMLGVDAVVLNFIYNQDNNYPIRSAFVYRQYVPEIENASQKDFLLADVSDIDKEDNEYLCFEYYWLGYVAILRVLLCFFSYSTVTNIIEIITVMCAIFLLFIVANKVNVRMAIVYLLGLYSINYLVLCKNIYMGALCVAVMCIGIIVWLEYKPQSIFNFMILLGMITAYMDYFSIPLVVWGGVTLIILETSSEETLFANINKTFNSGLGWALGYGGMILSKILVAFPMMGTTTWGNMSDRIKMELGTNVKVDYFSAVLRHIKLLHPNNYILSYGKKYFVIYLFILILLVVTMIFLISKKRYTYILALIIGMASFVWYWVFKGHIHHYIDYRTLFITVLAASYIIIDGGVLFFERNRNRLQLIKKHTSSDI